MNYKKLTEFILKKVLKEESLVTHTAKIVSEIGKHIPQMKLQKISSMHDGSYGEFFYELDGNTYEIEVRPKKVNKPIINDPKQLKGNLGNVNFNEQENNS